MATTRFISRFGWLAVSVLFNGCGDDREKPQVAVVSEAPEQSTVSSDAIEKSLGAAQAYLDSQDVARAQAILITLLVRAPNEMRAREMLGQSFLIAATHARGSGDVAAERDLRSRAYEQYRLVAAAAPESAELQHSAGLMAMQAGDSTAALQHFQKAARVDLNDPKYPLYEAQVLIQIGQLSEAEASLKRVLRLDADEAMAHASLAMIALERGQFDSALEHIGRGRAILPADLGLRVQEAKIHRRQGDPKRALELVIGLNDEERAREYVAFEIAAAYSDMGRHDDAARAWQHVHRSAPSPPTAWSAAVRAGECWLRAGQREQAAAWLREAERAAPQADEVKALQRAIDAAAEAP